MGKTFIKVVFNNVLSIILLFSFSNNINASDLDNENNVNISVSDVTEAPTSGKLDVDQSNLIPIEYTLGNNHERVLGKDQRIKVTNFKDTPFKQVVLLNMTFPNGKTYTGTGTMIDKNSVLTAGHNVYSKQTGGWATKIVVYAGVNGKNYEIGKAMSKKMYTLNQWKNKMDYQHDLAVIKLDSNLGNKTGTLPISSTIKLNDKLQTSGFPADKGGNIQYKVNGNLKKITTNNLFYDMDTNGGQSGSSVRSVNNKIVGVHTYGGENYNIATRLNSLNIDYIKHWTGKPIAHGYNKKVKLIRAKISVWNNLEFSSKRSIKNIKVGNVYRAKYLYNHPNGQKYLSLYDANNKWIGYFNSRDVTIIK